MKKDVINKSHPWPPRVSENKQPKFLLNSTTYGLRLRVRGWLVARSRKFPGIGYLFQRITSLHDEDES